MYTHIPQMHQPRWWTPWIIVCQGTTLSSLRLSSDHQSGASVTTGSYGEVSYFHDDTCLCITWVCFGSFLLARLFFLWYTETPRQSVLKVSVYPGWYCKWLCGYHDQANQSLSVVQLRWHAARASTWSWLPKHLPGYSECRISMRESREHVPDTQNILKENKQVLPWASSKRIHYKIVLWSGCLSNVKLDSAPSKVFLC